MSLLDDKKKKKTNPAPVTNREKTIKQNSCISVTGQALI